MADFSENFKNSNIVEPCRMCYQFRDSQVHAINCFETMKHVSTKGNINEVYTSNISRETAIMITHIAKVRKNKLG